MSSEVLIVRGSLLILNVLLVLPLDAAIGKLLGVNDILAVVQFPGTSPVPVHASHELKSCDLLVSKVGYDLEHLSTVAVNSEHLEVKEAWAIDPILKEEGASGNCANQVLSVLDVVPEMSLNHFIIIIEEELNLF